MIFAALASMSDSVNINSCKLAVAKNNLILLVATFLMFGISASAQVNCAGVHITKKAVVKTESIFEKAEMTKLSEDEVRPFRKLSAIWSEKARIKARNSWKSLQIEELSRILNTDAETAIDLYSKALDLQESYELPEYAFVVATRMEEAIAKLNLKVFRFEGESVELKFRYHSVNRFIFERLILETKQINFSAEQLAVLIQSEKIYRSAEERQLAGDKSAMSDAKVAIMVAISRYFPSDVIPDMKTALRIILVKGVVSKGCCGFGCSGCITFKVRGALELLKRVIGETTLPFVKTLQED